MVTKETILKFLNDTCSPEEAAEVKAYFDSNPEALNHLEREWDDFTYEKRLSDIVSGKLWDQIQKQTAPRPVIRIYLSRIAVAASIILAIILGWHFLIHKQENKDAQLIANQLKTISNTTTAAMNILLSDSSLVALMPNSTLTYPERFDSTVRNVSIEGEANFAVTKNPARPFTVFSDSITTTVLGTKFTVKSFSTDKQIKVVLYEGKVAVHILKRSFAGNTKAYILQPGDIFTYSKNTNKANLNHSRERVHSKQQVPDAGPNAVLQGDNWYMFNNQSLAEVLDQLAVFYHTKIIYSKAAVRGKTFIGKIEKTDSLETILKSIGVLNNLKVSQKDNTYIIE